MITASNNWQQLAAQYGGNAESLVVVFTIGGSPAYNRVFTSYIATGFPSNYYAWITKSSAMSLRQAARDGRGGSDASSLEITVLDGDLAYPQAITKDYAALTAFDGRPVTIQVGFPFLALADYMTLATLVIDHVDYDKELTSYRFILRDQSVLLQNYAFTVANDGFPTSDNHHYSVIDTPSNLITTALESAGLPAGSINTSALATVAANYWPGLKMDFDVSYPPQAKQWVEQEIMEPLGGYWYWNAAGQWTPYIMLPLSPPSSVMTLDETNLAESRLPVPTESQDYISTVTFRLDGDPNGQNFKTIIVEVYGPAATIVGIQKSTVIQARGLRSTSGGVRFALLTIQNLFRRYGLKPLTLDVTAFASALRLELSDKVSVQHKLLPARAKGLYEVVEKESNLRDGTVNLTLLNVNWESATAYQIAPDPPAVPAWTSATAAQKAQYMFVSGSNGKYSNGDAGNVIY